MANIKGLASVQANFGGVLQHCMGLHSMEAKSNFFPLTFYSENFIVF